MGKNYNRFYDKTIKQVPDTKEEVIESKPIVVETPVEEPKKIRNGVVNCGTELNFRRYPTKTDDNIIQTLKPGEKFEILEEKDEWTKIIYNKKIGWVMSHFVKEV